MRLALLALLALLVLPCLVSALTMDAGGDQTLAFPATALTLFGHASAPDTHLLTYAWSQVSGPGGARFSASAGLHTTVTFAQTGTYVFRLTVVDGGTTLTDDMTAVVRSAASQTAFYVDPTYTGGSNDGSAAHPWTTLFAGGSPDSTWTTMNAALASSDVIVYFSARHAGTDSAETSTQETDIWRTDTSTHRLTFDGMSKYNTNDSSGSWLDYTGSHKHILHITSGSLSIGVQSTNPSYPMHYTTIRGFEATGTNGRVLLAGNFAVVEECHVHDITNGSVVQVQSAVIPYPTCTAEFGNLHGLTLRHNVIHDTNGEALYIGGNYTRASDGGCLAWGNTHHDILIEGNTVSRTAVLGGEGDGVDLKAGLYNVTIRHNTFTSLGGSGHGIISLGTDPAQPILANYVIENNHFHDTALSAISFGSINGEYRHVTIRNNLLSGGGAGISLAGDTTDGVKSIFTVRIENNTILAGLVFLEDADGVVLRNNIVFADCATLGLSDCPLTNHFGGAINIDSDYNVLAAPGYSGAWTEGAHTQIISGDVTATTLVLNPVSGDGHLRRTSPARDTGTNLSALGFATDQDGRTRPQGSAWDIGAFEYTPDVPHFRAHQP